MSYEHKVTRRVEFADTDMAGIMHHSNFFRFMETAEHDFYRSLGFSVVMPDTDPRLGWPRVHAECDFSRPLRFEDEVEIHLIVREKKSKSITYEFRFRKVKTGDTVLDPPEDVAVGKLTIVCVSHKQGEEMKAASIPPEIDALIQVAP